MQPSNTTRSIEIGLNAVIVSVVDPMPLVLAIGARTDMRADKGAFAASAPASRPEPQSLPFGPFDPLHHRTFEIGLRAWVEEQTALRLGYVEQLYTFGDRGRHFIREEGRPHEVSVGYLALTRQTSESEDILFRQNAHWCSWYDYFPWEDWREATPEVLHRHIFPALESWAEATPPAGTPPRALSRAERIKLAFGGEEAGWDEEKVLDRYELLYEAGLVEEALRDGRPAALLRASLPPLGRSMKQDHRRILATAISRLRAKLKYRPVVFELMPDAFTLTALQRTVEAISGRHLHKQNFRRLVEKNDLVEPTGDTSTTTGGRPAALFRFRREILKERPALGLKVGGR